MSIPAGFQKIKTVQTAVSIKELRSVLVCAPGSGKESRDKAAFSKVYQLGIHKGISQFSPKAMSQKLYIYRQSV